MGYSIGLCPEGALTVEEQDTVEFDEKNAEDQPGGTDISIKCFKCNKGEDEVYLLPLRHKMKSEWVCTQCLPMLIHG